MGTGSSTAAVLDCGAILQRGLGSGKTEGASGGSGETNVGEGVGVVGFLIIVLGVVEREGRSSGKVRCRRWPGERHSLDQS